MSHKFASLYNQLKFHDEALVKINQKTAQKN